jgi:hypothetical protein
MLVSFLATLEGGVSFSSEVAETAAHTRRTETEGSANAAVPGLTSLLGLTLGMNGKLKRDSEQVDTVETKLVRQHTAASLFNSLRHRLYRDSSVTRVHTARDLSRAVSGSIVEMAGRIDESPLRRLVDLMNNFYPFMEEHAQAALRKIPTVKRNQRSGLSPEQRAMLELAESAAEQAKDQLEESKQLMRIVELIDQDMKGSPLSDLVVQGDGVAGFVSVHQDYLSDDMSAGLLGGTFKVLGKVTGVDSAADAHAPVVRRGAMGAVSESVIEPMLENMRNSAGASGLRIDLPEGQLRGPYLQMIPLAIFV